MKKHDKRQPAITTGSARAVYIDRSVYRIVKTKHKTVVDNSRKKKKRNKERVEPKPLILHDALLRTDEPDGFYILSSSYDKASYLGEWAASILRQSYRPLNVVFVDDFSLSGDSQVMINMAQKFKDAGIGLRVIRNNNRFYCSTSYRIANEHAINGAFFGVVDSDDVLTHDAVAFVAGLYKSTPDASFIYTQFTICDEVMKLKKNGFCAAPGPEQSLLDTGLAVVHAFSHWRTYSSRLDTTKLWKDGLRCAVDKYMAYRLEELGRGYFVNKVCYLYREGIKHSISKMEKTKKSWREICHEAVRRRERNKIVPYLVSEIKLN